MIECKIKLNANNYKFTYNLDGGHFIDGSTERTEIIDSYSVVGAFRLNPLKKRLCIRSI